MGGLMRFSCLGFHSSLYPYRPLVNRYARLGLHPYNMKEVTNFKLHHLIKFNFRSSGASSFLMTLAAVDPVANSLVQTFQVQVDEANCGFLDVICSISRIRGDTTSERFSSSYDNARLPDWPSHNFIDSQRFYLVQGSELPYPHWIYLYLELAVLKYDIRISDVNLSFSLFLHINAHTTEGDCWLLLQDFFWSNLEIVQVAIETTEEAPLQAKNSILYITFKGLATGGIGQHVERKAIIKSFFSEPSGFLSLKGHLCKEEEEDLSHTATINRLREISRRNRELYLRSRTTV
ncbi:PREDICTED: UPF0725 protein EMB2204-like isoform X1 [Camelina sativa]|uniref:UPF0725 protein EMB2204-like isoform X1 n=1 Tax=Camelina sativa TaxID=90675 RepID=A0ABM1QMP9_CAMSA|nr:PREDICTED: UPF0725 protein EMB2204-like isoform X1 [Camelina sativa]